MRSVVELNRGEYAQLAFISILERIGERRKTFFSSLLGVELSAEYPSAQLIEFENTIAKR